MTSFRSNLLKVRSQNLKLDLISNPLFFNLNTHEVFSFLEVGDQQYAVINCEVFAISSVYGYYF